MFATLLNKLYRHNDLTIEEAAAAMTEIMEGRASPAQISGLLIGLHMKGEKPTEIVGLAQAMRTSAVHLESVFHDVFDTCGTGGDGSNTFNVSSIVAIVVAACGVRVAKHGNRSVSSRCGSADLFEALGVQLSLPVTLVEHCLEEVGIAFFFAPTFHPSMRHAAKARKDLGVRTAFNLLGPLTNPAGARRQLVGVPRPELTDLVARSLGLLGSDRVWVVHGADGLDEISTTGYTKISEYQGGFVNTFYVHPREFGLKQAKLSSLTGGGVEENAVIAKSILGGERSEPREVVLFNAGAALFVAGRVGSVHEGLELAADAIDSGRAVITLEKMAKYSQGVNIVTA